MLGLYFQLGSLIYLELATIAEGGLEHLIFLPLFPRYWDYRHVSLNLALEASLILDYETK